LINAALAVCVFACGSSGDGTARSGPFVQGEYLALTQIEDVQARYPIVFHSDRGGLLSFGLYVMSPDGGGRDAIAVTDPGSYFQPRWSPDGRSIAFRFEMGGVRAEVGLIETESGQLVTLTSGEDPGFRNRAPAWSPDGERIAFDSIRASAGESIWMVSRLGGEAEPLLPDLEAIHREVTWSPDGSRVAYSARTGQSRQRDLFVAELDDLSGAMNLTRGRVYAPTFLRWSPDGSRIVFASAPVLEDGSPEPEGPATDGRYVPPNSEIFVSEVETGVVTRLTNDSRIDTEPAWAPDSQSVIFTKGTFIGDDLDPDLWLLPLDAPEMAHTLIDDEDDPTEEGGADWWRPE
jgi:Tol biopolymer transport system component